MYVGSKTKAAAVPEIINLSITGTNGSNNELNIALEQREKKGEKRDK